MDLSNISVVNNEVTSRWEARVGDRAAFLDYALDSSELTLVRTVVPPSLGGQGVGGKLARAALDFAREQGMTVIPRCPFVAAYIDRHPEYQDLVAPSSL